jgi:hypothetical protein
VCDADRTLTIVDSMIKQKLLTMQAAAGTQAQDMITALPVTRHDAQRTDGTDDEGGTPVQTPPNEPQAQLRWLVDRAQISDVLVEYARCADAADWSGMSALFTEDGVAVFAAGTFPGRNFGEAAGAVMARFCGTHHLSTNHAIHIDGDRATTRSYVQAVHLTDPDDNSRHHDVGGWYDNELVRTPDGWHFARVELSFVWTAGAPWPTAEDTAERQGRAR